jgi:hypothetical protein
MLSLFLNTSIPQVAVYVDASEADEFLEVVSKPLRSLPYDSPGQTFVAFEKPEGVPATGKFSNMLRFIVKEVRVCSTAALCCCTLSASSFQCVLCVGLVV